MLLVVECDPYSPVPTFPGSVPDCRSKQFFEDEMRIYSRFPGSPLPVAIGLIQGNPIVVAQRARYVDCARRLGRATRILIRGCDEIPDAITEKVRVIPEIVLQKEREEDEKKPTLQI